MDRKAKRFWIPWAGIMSLAVVFMLMGASKNDAGAQVNASWPDGGMVPYIDVTKIPIVLASAAASQPAIAASQPAVVPLPNAGFLGWLGANASWLIPLLITLLSSLATGLGDYPTTTEQGASRLKKVVRVLRVVAGCLSLVQFRNSPGSLKAPLAPPAKP